MKQTKPKNIKPLKGWAVKLTYKEFKIFTRKWEARLYAVRHPYIIKEEFPCLITPINPKRKKK